MTNGDCVSEMETLTTRIPFQVREKLRERAYIERTGILEVARQILTRTVSEVTPT
jgi:hypothetical protein